MELCGVLGGARVAGAGASVSRAWRAPGRAGLCFGDCAAAPAELNGG